MLDDQPPLMLKKRATDAHKGCFGRVLLIGGTRGMTGSIAMSAMAALRGGAGLVSAAIPDRCLETVAVFHPALMTIPLSDDGHGYFADESGLELPAIIESVDVIACGPGLRRNRGAISIVENLLENREKPRVLDADAINSLSLLVGDRSGAFLMDRIRNGGPMVFTPHPGELHRLTGVSASNREKQIEATLELSRDTQSTWVLKGGPSVVIHEGNIWVNSTGNPGMATAGSGDVLTGLIAALIGQGLSCCDAARLGVWVHGRAGDIAADRFGWAGLVATDLIQSLPTALSCVVDSS